MILNGYFLIFAKRKREEMSTPTKNYPHYYISPTAVSVNENAVEDNTSYIAVSVVSGTLIMLSVKEFGTRIPAVGYTAAQENPTWRLSGYDTYLQESYKGLKVFFYARLETKGTSGLLIFSTTDYTTSGGKEQTVALSADGSYIYVKLGHMPPPSGGKNTLTWDTGCLLTQYGKDNASDDSFSRLFQLVNDVIVPQHNLSEITVEGLITALGGIVLSGNEVRRLRTYADLNNLSQLLVEDDSIASCRLIFRYIEEKLEQLDDRFLRKDIDDAAKGRITFEKGITVLDEARFEDDVEFSGKINPSGNPLRVEGDLLAGQDVKGDKWNIDKEGAAHFIKLLVDALAEMGDARADTMGNKGDFRDGFFGEGWRIWQDPDSGEWCMTIDRLTVRGTMSVYELLVQKIRSVGGMIAVSAANGKVKSVEELTDYYRITFEEKNQFVPGDLMRCQTFSGSALKSYWVEVASAESDGYSVLVPKSEFTGSLAEPGDECVLMGSTSDAKRRSLIAISATEDGYPRIEVLNGIKSKSFEGCLRAQLGNLDNIDDADFADLMPLGDGLYSDNAYLKGVFRLKDGRDVGEGLDTLSTSITIMRGEFDSKIQGLRQDFIEEKGFLSNPVFTYGLDHWKIDNSGIYTYMLAGKFFFVNGSILSYKEAGTDIVDVEGRKCVRLRASRITQPNGELREKPDIEDTDSEGRPVAPFVYLSVMYRCTVGGKLRYGFSDRDDSGFAPMNALEGEADISPEGTWKQFQAFGQWNGTGDFFLDFSGELLITTVIVTADKTQALIYRTETEIRQLSDRIELIAKNFDEEGNLTAAGELLTTAEFNKFTSATFNEDGTLKNTSGLVTTSGFASLFSTTAEENGLTVTSANFDDWFAESAESRGYIGSAQIATMITDGIGKAVITADQVYIRSGSRDESLDNYFFLDGSTGNVTMHDLYAHDITVEGVINNLVMHITVDNLSEVTCQPLTDADLVSYIRGEVSLESYSGAYRSLDVLRCPAVLSFEGSFTDINSLGHVCLALPYFYWYGAKFGTTVEEAGYAKNYLRTQTAYNTPAPLPFDGFLSSAPSSMGSYKDSDAPDKILFYSGANCFIALFGTEHYATWKNDDGYNEGTTVNKNGAFVYDGQLYKWNETAQSLVAISVNARLVNVEDLWQCVGKRITVFNRSQGELHLLLNEEFRLTEDDTGQRYYRVEEEEDCIREVIIAPSGYTVLEFCSGFCAMSETARSGLPAFFWRLNTHTTDTRYLIQDSDW